MPRLKPDTGGGGNGGGGAISVVGAGISLTGMVELTVQDGIKITVYPEQRRIEFYIGFDSEVHGDVMFRGASGWQRLAAGTPGQQLTTNGPGADPTWT